MNEIIVGSNFMYELSCLFSLGVTDTRIASFMLLPLLLDLLEIVSYDSFYILASTSSSRFSYFLFFFFLFSCVLRDSKPRFVDPSVRLSVRQSVRPSVHMLVRPSHFTFSAFMGYLAVMLLPKCSTDL